MLSDQRTETISENEIHYQHKFICSKEIVVMLIFVSFNYPKLGLNPINALEWSTHRYISVSSFQHLGKTPPVFGS